MLEKRLKKKADKIAGFEDLSKKETAAYKLINKINKDVYSVIDRLIEMVIDQSKLETLALTHPISLVRSYAVEKVKNQEIVLRIFENDDEWYVRNSAVSAITNQEKLKKIAKEYSFGDTA